MERYMDIDGDSGAYAYEIGPDSIRVQFEDGGIYLYTYASAGPQNIEHRDIGDVREILTFLLTLFMFV